MTVDGKKSAAPAGAHVEITAKGRAQGNYGCNHFGADVKVDGDTVTVGPAEMTEMACAKDIQGFEDALRAAFSGKLKAKLADGKLTLTTEKGDSIALTSERPAPLVGTKWTVNSLVSDGTASSLPAGTEKKAYLTFGKDGSVQRQPRLQHLPQHREDHRHQHHLRPPRHHPEACARGRR